MGKGGHSQHHHENEQAYNLMQQDQIPHEAKLSHELVGGAAGFFAMKKYEDHLRETGQQPSHALFKEMLAGAAGFEVDRLAETKGMDMLDRHKAKKHAEEQAEQMYNARYQPDQYQAPQQGFGYGLGGGQYQGGGGQGGGGGYGQQGGGYGGGGGGGYGGQQGGGGYGGQQGGGGYGGQQGGGGYGGQQGGGGYGGQGQGQGGGYGQQGGGGYGGGPPGGYPQQGGQGGYGGGGRY